MIRDLLVERKGLKQVERKGLKEGFKVTRQIKSITWINQTMSFQVSIKNDSLDRGHFSLWLGLATFGR
jgi:hypothetical protein